MLKGIVLLLFAVVGCHADTTVTPDSGVHCGRIPEFLYLCLGQPRLIEDFPVKCRSDSECDETTCIFADIGWMDGNEVNKTAISKYYDQYAHDHPAWSKAVKHLKADCLGDSELPAQGIHLNCAPYDIMHCSIISFIRNARPSQWLNSTRCQYPRAFASVCPICPNMCFGKNIPYGACNACLVLPRSVVPNNFILSHPKNDEPKPE